MSSPVNFSIISGTLAVTQILLSGTTHNGRVPFPIAILRILLSIDAI